ncbi:hypothetical protein SVAN01_02238 [Stagonosporopsis vannaccii]|nr:hypothetical protein SVAN01_02238 [Stagonosporopsis vannaccii]
MPAVVRESMGGLVTLEARRWDQSDNRAVVSPTALAFLIPVLVVFFFAPFLCIFCIRRRGRDTPVRRRGRASTKKPALERSEARERLQSVVEVSNVTRNEKAACVDRIEEKTVSDSESTLEKECAICLSSLRAPSPPEPAKLNNENGVIEEAAIAPAKSDFEQEEILRLKECGHEFHAECLISWVVLHKTSCPICRTVFYEEPEKPADVEAQTTSADTVPAEPVTPPQPPVTNWHYFWTGRDARQSHTGPGVRSSLQHFRNFRS